MLFALLQFARLWVIATLGPRWTTRIIVLPGAPLVRTGPYRFVDHPNYLIVTLEIAVLPLVFGLSNGRSVFSLLNAAVLWVRIRAENQALGRAKTFALLALLGSLLASAPGRRVRLHPAHSERAPFQFRSRPHRQILSSRRRRRA